MTNISTKELIELHTQAIKAEIKAGNDMVSYEIRELVQRVDKQNGSVAKLKEKMECLERETGLARWVKKNPGYAIIVLVVLIVVVPIVVDKIGFESILRLIK